MPLIRMNRELTVQRLNISSKMNLGQRCMLRVRKQCHGTQVVMKDVSMRKRTETGCAARENPRWDRPAHVNDLRDSIDVDAGSAFHSSFLAISRYHAG